MTDVVYKKKDFVSDQEIRWCPGCGDYSILASVQLALTKIGKKKEDIVCVSGIGCSSRFPYYLDTYGYHTIHGRAPAVASGMKVANPNLSVWVMTGDGDSLSIGGNHLIHTLRRNIDLNIIMFNNQIYGLTKGQYSPTSAQGQVTKSSPYGSLDRTFNPGMLALGANATFIAKTLDTDPKHMMGMMQTAEKHRGTSFVEVFQNCVIFNDKCHEGYTARQTRADQAVYIENGQPLIYGADKNKGVILDGYALKLVELGEQYKEEDVLVHDSRNKNLAYLLLNANEDPEMPKFYGVIFESDSDIYDQQIVAQIEEIQSKKGQGDFIKLLNSGETWTVK